MDFEHEKEANAVGSEYTATSMPLALETFFSSPEARDHLAIARH